MLFSTTLAIHQRKFSDFTKLKNYGDLQIPGDEFISILCRIPPDLRSPKIGGFPQQLDEIHHLHRFFVLSINSGDVHMIFPSGH
jgi:hypothetical protein